MSQLGLYKGHLWSAASEDLRGEAAQFRLWEDRDFQLETARAVAWGKLMNSKQLLMRLNRRRVQLSVFECFLTLKEMHQLHQALQKWVEPEKDNVRLYWITADSVPRALTLGSATPEPPPDVYVL